jgi:hypothetical protein
MAKLNIPEYLKRGLHLVTDFSKKQKNGLIQQLVSLEIGVSRKELQESFCKELKIDLSQSNALVDLIFSFSISDELSVKTEDFAADLVETIKNKKDHTLKSYLIKMIQSSKGESLVALVKGSFIIGDRENIYRESKIYTDIRPIYTNPNSNELKILGHSALFNLKVSYVKSADEGQRKNIFLALDREDLKKLKEEIVRAENKASLVKKTYSNKPFISQ